jgi:hypothetical protein
MKNMRKIFFSLMLLNIVSLPTFAQEHPYPELQILFADADYEKLIVKAEKLSLKYPDEPLPVIYFSMGLHSISKTDKASDPLYANAWKESITKASTAIKLDNKKGKGQLKEGYYKDYILELESEIYEFFTIEIETSWYTNKDLTKAQLDKDTKMRDKMYGELSKASGFAGTFTKLAPQMAFYNKYFDGAMKFYANDKTTATAKWKEANDLIIAVKKENVVIDKANADALKKNPSAKQKPRKMLPDSIVGFNDWTDIEKKMFVHCGLLSANALNKAAKPLDRDKILNLIKELITGDADLSTFYEEQYEKIGIKF